MTYGEILEEAKKVISEEIIDYRPAAGMFIEGISEEEQIPRAILCWLKNGAKIIYILPKVE